MPMLSRDRQYTARRARRRSERGQSNAVPFVVDEARPVGAKHFSSYVLKMKASNVNAMLFLSAPADGITLLRQMKGQQLKLRYIHGLAAFWPTELAKTLGNGGDYVIHDGFWGEVNLNAEELKDIGPMVRERIEQEEAILRDWLEEQKGGTT